MGPHMSDIATLQEKLTSEQHWTTLSNTVGRRYKAVQINKILQTSLQELRRNINQRMKPQNTSHTSP